MCFFLLWYCILVIDCLLSIRFHSFHHSFGSRSGWAKASACHKYCYYIINNYSSIFSLSFLSNICTASIYHQVSQTCNTSNMVWGVDVFLGFLGILCRNVSINFVSHPMSSPWCVVGELPASYLRLPRGCLDPHATCTRWRATQGTRTPQSQTTATPAHYTLRHRGRNVAAASILVLWKVLKASCLLPT